MKLIKTNKTCSRLLSIFLALILCLSAIPLSVFAALTDYTLTITHNITGTDETAATGDGGFIGGVNLLNANTYDNAAIDNASTYAYGIKQYWAQLKSDSHILEKIRITHGTNSKEIPIAVDAPIGSNQTIACAGDLSLTGTALNAVIIPSTGSINISVQRVSPNANITIEFVWVKATDPNAAIYPVSVANSENGQAGADFEGNIDGGSQYRLQATPNIGYGLDHWEYKGASTGDEWTKDNDSVGQDAYQITVGEDREYRAVFAPTVILLQNLSVSVANGSSSVSIYAGQSVDFSVQYEQRGKLNPNTSYEFKLYSGAAANGTLLGIKSGSDLTDYYAVPQNAKFGFTVDAMPGISQVTVSAKLGANEPVVKTYNVTVLAPESLGAKAIQAPPILSYPETVINCDVLAFTDETTGSLSLYAAGTVGVMEYGSSGFTKMPGITLASGSAGMSGNGRIASINGTKDKLTAFAIQPNGYLIYEYTPEEGQWAEVPNSSRSSGYVDGVFTVDDAAAGIVISANEVYKCAVSSNGTGPMVWDGASWKPYECTLNSFIRANPTTYYAGGSDGLYKHKTGGWEKFSSLTGAITVLSAGTDGGLLAASDVGSNGSFSSTSKFYRVSPSGAVMEVDAAAFMATRQNLYSLSLDYAGNVYALTAYGVYKQSGGGWILQTAEGKALAETGVITKATTPLPNVTLFTGVGGAYYLKAGESTLTLDPANGGEKIKIKGTINSAVTQPAAPTLDDYTFTGWYFTANPADKSPFDFVAMPAADVTLYAHWAANSAGGDPFADARETALASLDTAYAGYAQTDYTGAEWAQVQSAYNSGKTAVTNASGYQGIQDALNGAKNAMAAVSASNVNTATIAVTVERFTLNGGYIVEPILLTVPRNVKASQVITNLLKARYPGIAQPYKNTGNIDTAFYLSYVYLPGYTNGSYPNFLGEFDEGQQSGWMYSVNNYFPNVGSSDWTMKPGDVMRWQYTKVGLGEDIGGGQASGGSSAGTVRANKDALTWRMAEINTNENKADYGAAYTNAMTVLTKLDATQQAVDDALAALGGDRPVPGKSSDASVAALTVGGVAATVAPGNIYSATLPQGTNLATLTAANIQITLHDSKAGVTAGPTASNGGTVWTFTVTAEDGESAATYTLNLSVSTAPAQPVDYTKALADVLTYIRSQVQFAEVGSVGGEWAILAEARGGRKDEAWNKAYLNTLEAFLKDPGNVYSYDPATGKVKIHNVKITDNERVILALTSLGVDASNFRGFDLVSALLEKNEGGRFKVAAQGLNGAIFALISLDSGNYLDDAAGRELRNWCIDYLLTHEKTSGGWDLFGTPDGFANADITGMALQALAPYFKNASSYKQTQVNASVKKALQALKNIQEPDGSFTYGSEGKTSESAAQVLVALTALGYDGTADDSFLKSVVENLLTYRDAASGGFKHVLSGSVDEMGSEQAAYALVAYDRYVKGQTTLYDMSDLKLKEDNNKNTDAVPDTVVKDLENGTGIFITAKPGVLPSGVELWIDPLPSGDKHDRAKAALQDKGGAFTLFDIYLLKNNEEIQPNGKITISIPVPDGYTAELCKMYRINEDGSITDMNAVLKDGYLVFATDHLSLYAVWQSVAVNNTGDTGNGSQNTNTGDGQSPKTGDAGNVTLWLWLSGIALLGLVVTARRRKQQNV
ncbi:MAG: DUF4430 domain-containing protein [Oscillospiraceae bacterium]|jgi:uncharacterized repeat protein (TIGR02543 family)|nr:DUF4430 domain-containing protein [Oscillospiraceae bacterium]